MPIYPHQSHHPGITAPLHTHLYILIYGCCVQLDDHSSWESTSDSRCKQRRVFPPFFACHQSGGRDFRFPRLYSRAWIMQQCGVACLTEWLDKNSCGRPWETSLHWKRTAGAKYKSCQSPSSFFHSDKPEKGTQRKCVCVHLRIGCRQQYLKVCACLRVCA